MEIEFDSRENAWMLYVTVALIVAVAVFGLASFGERVTPLDAAGTPKVLTWSDWRAFQARRAYNERLSILRADASEIARMLNESPDPIAAQIMARTVRKHVETGGSELAPQRLALADAAAALERWSMGLTDRETAIAALERAAETLK
jgi:hypothetical protein